MKSLRRIRGKNIRTVLCCIVHSEMHTHNDQLLQLTVGLGLSSAICTFYSLCCLLFSERSYRPSVCRLSVCL